MSRRAKEYRPKLHLMSDHRLPTINEVTENYHRLGTGVATPEDIPELYGILDTINNSAGNPVIKRVYFGWLNYELGLAHHQTDKVYALRHYIVAAKAMSEIAAKKDFLISASGEFNIYKNVSLIGLLRSRLELGERTDQLQHQATIRELGRLAGKTLASMGMYDDSQDRREHRGVASEILVAGVSLLNDGSGIHLMPAPASPRQNSPHYVKEFRGDKRPPGLVTEAHNFNMMRYQASEDRPIDIIPTQVKTREQTRYQTNPYASSILMLYADRDLFIDSTQEFIDMSEALSDYSMSQPLPKNLMVARSNVDLAVSLHLEEATHEASSLGL